MTPPLQTSVDNLVLSCCGTSRLVMGNLSFSPFPRPTVGPSRTAAVPVPAARDGPRSCLPLPWSPLPRVSLRRGRSSQGAHLSPLLFLAGTTADRFYVSDLSFSPVSYLWDFQPLLQNSSTVPEPCMDCTTIFFSLGKFWFFVFRREVPVPKNCRVFLLHISIARAGLSAGLWLAPKGTRLVLHHCMTTLSSCDIFQNHYALQRRVFLFSLFSPFFFLFCLR